MADIAEFSFGDLTWLNGVEYPTLVETENEVREMMQKQPNAIAQYINGTLVHEINTVLKPAIAGKQNTLTFDSAPAAGSANPVKSGGVKTALDAKQDLPRFVSVQLTATWSGTNALYTQSVYVPGVTARDEVSVILTPAQRKALYLIGVASVSAENDNGSVTVSVVGAKPTEAMTVQLRLSEATV